MRACVRLCWLCVMVLVVNCACVSVSRVCVYDVLMCVFVWCTRVCRCVCGCAHVRIRVSRVWSFGAGVCVRVVAKLRACVFVYMCVVSCSHARSSIFYLYMSE